MQVKYHFMEPGEDVALVRLGRVGRSRIERSISSLRSAARISATSCRPGPESRAAGFRRHVHAHRPDVFRVRRTRGDVPDRLAGTAQAAGRPDSRRSTALRLYKAGQNGGDASPRWNGSTYPSPATRTRLSLQDVLETAGRVPFATGMKSSSGCLRRTSKSGSLSASACANG